MRVAAVIVSRYTPNVRLEDIHWDERGLIPAIAQDWLSGRVCMLAYANREALEATLETQQAHFFSRSRQGLWKKGESSGNILEVCEVWTDCDKDTLLYLVEPRGPACHTGERTCFFERIDSEATHSKGAVSQTSAAKKVAVGAPVMAKLFFELESRKSENADKSYTKSLLQAGPEKIAAKVREECEEFLEAVANESDERVACEAGDLVYHQLVALLSRGVSWEDVTRVLASRFALSGIEEKRRRK